MKNNESSIFSSLITNTDFRDWVISPDNESNYFWEKWMDEHPKAITEVKKAREFIKGMNFKTEQLAPYELEDLFDKIIAEEKPLLQSMPHKDKRKDFSGINHWLKVAAILIICFISTYIVSSLVSQDQVEPAPVAIQWKTAENPKGRKSKITLPDGSQVMLNSASELKYPEVFADSQRVVSIKGEAFFEVVRDEHRPFIIQTERMTTEVLGTSFNIKAYDNGETPYTAVVSGRVKVSNTRGDTEILSPNEMGLIDLDNNINKASFDLKQVTGWKDGIISFKRASFKEIQDQLSMWYGVDFIVDKGFKMENVYTGEFVNENLENVMNGIAYSSGFTYKITDNQVFIYK